MECTDNHEKALGDQIKNGKKITPKKSRPCTKNTIINTRNSVRQALKNSFMPTNPTINMCSIILTSYEQLSIKDYNRLVEHLEKLDGFLFTVDVKTLICHKYSNKTE